MPAPVPRATNAGSTSCGRRAAEASSALFREIEQWRRDLASNFTRVYFDLDTRRAFVLCIDHQALGTALDDHRHLATTPYRATSWAQPETLLGFNIPGLGRALVEAILREDFPVVLAVVMLSTFAWGLPSRIG